MKQVYIINENHPQLLLFFAGWAADETPFKQYRPKDMDYMICYDYRTLDFDYSIFDRTFRIGTSEHARQRKRQNTETPTRSADIRSIGADPDWSLYVYHPRQ